MSSALYVTTKVFCKRAWLGALLAVGLLVLGPLLFVAISKILAVSVDHFSDNLRGYYFSYLAISLVCFVAVSLHALSGTQNLCRGLPVSSRAIASWIMLAMVGLIVVLQLVTNGAYRYLFFDQGSFTNDWPVLGPLLFMITLTLVGNFIYWSLKSPSFARVIFCVSLIGGLLWWFISRYYPNGFQKAFVLWNQVTVGELMTLQLVSLGAWYQGTRDFARVRAGTAAPSIVWNRVERVWTALISGSRSRRLLLPLSKQATLAQMHWRDSCQLAVIVGGGVIGVAVLLINLQSTISFNHNSPGINDYPELVESFYGMTWLFSWISAIFIAVLSGRGMNAAGRTEMRLFLAMAPLSDQNLCATFCRNVVKTFVFSFLLLQATFLLNVLGLWLIHGSEGLSTELDQFNWGRMYFNFTLVVVAGFWIIGANLISILWTGRTWFYWTMLSLFIGGILFLFGYEFVSRQILAGYEIKHFLEMTLVLSISFLLIAGTGIAYRVAYKKGLIGSSVVLTAFVCWLLISSFACYYVFPSNFRIELLDELFFLTAILSLLVTPFATIPLAVSWNRHR